MTGGPLAFVHLLERRLGRQLGRLAIDVEDPVAHLHRVPRQPDDPLDEVLPVHRVAEDDDIATVRRAAEDAAREGAHRERAGMAGIAVGHLVDEEEVADQQRVLHRSRRDPERLKEQGAEDPRDQQRVDHGLHRFPYAVLLGRRCHGALPFCSCLVLPSGFMGRAAR
jgi:hypothetical protein